MRMFATGVVTATLALCLAACNGTDSPSGDKASSTAVSTAPTKVAPDAKQSPSTSPAAPSVSSDQRFSNDEVCAQLPAQRIHDVLGLKPEEKVTPTDITADPYETDGEKVEKRDPNLCTYKLPVEPNWVAIGVGSGSDASEAWSAVKALG